MEVTMKKIFIDASSLCRKKTGIENVTFHLLKILLQTDTENEYHIIFRKYIDRSIANIANNRCKMYLSPFSSQLLTEQIYIPLINLKNRFDVSVFPCFPPGLFVTNKIVFICPDAANWKYKKCLLWKNRLYFKPLATLALIRAKIVFTISISSSSDITYYFPFIANKICLLTLALTNESTFCQQHESVNRPMLMKFGITKQYLFCVGSLEPRKNIEFIINNIDGILERYDLNLVLTGRKAWGNTTIKKAIAESKARDRIIKTDFVSNEELNLLYRNAEMFLFPSLYEGFGFPILEAFACQCPVITSNVSSMPEVAGDAALLIDPKNGNDLKEAIIAILTNPQLKNDLNKKAAERLKYFKWEKTACEFMKKINEI
jgi:glycosyltransferase involved in cell wall biosynthesis